VVGLRVRGVELAAFLVSTVYAVLGTARLAVVGPIVQSR